MAAVIKLEWAGKEYVITEGEAFRAAAEVEEFVTIFELHGMFSNPKIAKLSSAYAALLRFCGATVSDRDVWDALTNELRNGKQNERLGAVHGLFAILLGDAPKMEGGDDDSDTGEKKS
jgi:hypothetical protein